MTEEQKSPPQARPPIANRPLTAEDRYRAVAALRGMLEAIRSSTKASKEGKEIEGIFYPPSTAERKYCEWDWLLGVVPLPPVPVHPEISLSDNKLTWQVPYIELDPATGKPSNIDHTTGEPVVRWLSKTVPFQEYKEKVIAEFERCTGKTYSESLAKEFILANIVDYERDTSGAAKGHAPFSTNGIFYGNAEELAQRNAETTEIRRRTLAAVGIGSIPALSGRRPKKADPLPRRDDRRSGPKEAKFLGMLSREEEERTRKLAEELRVERERQQAEAHQFETARATAINEPISKEDAELRELIELERLTRPAMTWEQKMALMDEQGNGVNTSPSAPKR